jgi:hypothetical protein
MLKGTRKKKKNLDSVDRSKPCGWMKYMLANPGYFICEFKKPATKENIAEEFNALMGSHYKIKDFF